MNIRAANSEQDLEVIQDLYNTFYPAAVPNIPRLLTTHSVQVAESHDGQVIGIRTLSPAHFVWVAVAAENQRNGIGRLLMNDVLEQSSQSGITELISRVDDASEAGQAFCERFGFKTYLHMVNLELDLTTWNSAAIPAHTHHDTDRGIVFKTYADYEDTEETRQKLYELNKALSITIPRSQPQPFVDFDTYIERRLLPETSPYAGIFLAVDGDQWIGMSQVSLHDDYAFNEMTGVLPPYRGSGIAQALKLRTTQFAQHSGHNVIRTFNDVSNGPMIAVNEKIGFQRGKSFYQVRRKLL